MSSTTHTHWTFQPGSVRWQSLAGFAVRGTGLLLGYGLLLTLTGQLGASGYGAFTTALAIGSLLATLVTCGTDRMAARLIPRLRDGDQSGVVREVTGTFVVGLLGIGVGLIVLAAFGIATPLSTETHTVLSSAILLFPVLLLIAVRQWTALPLQGAAASILPEQILLPSLVIGCVWLGQHGGWTMDVRSIVALYAICGLLAFGTGVWTSPLRSLLSTGARSAISVTDTHDRLRNGLPFLSASLATVAMNRTLPLLIALLLGFQQAGRLAAAVQLAALVAIPLNVVNLVIMPRCARLHSRTQRHELTELVRKACLLCTLTAIPVAVALLLCSSDIAGLLGRDFQTTGRLLAILVIGQSINALCGPNGSVLQMVGHERLYSSTLMVTNTLMVVTVIAASRIGDMVAVAIAIVVVEALRNAFLAWHLWRREGIVMLPALSWGGT